MLKVTKIDMNNDYRYITIDFMIEWSPQKGFVSTYFKFKPKMSYALFTSPTRTRQNKTTYKTSVINRHTSHRRDFTLMQSANEIISFTFKY